MSTLEKPQWDLYHPQDGNIEHDLFDSVIVEHNDITGIKIKYYIRDENIAMDRLYGESDNTAFLGPYETKVTYDVTGEPTMVDPFGMTSMDVIEYAWIPKSTFTRDVSAGYEPKPGDVIQTLWNRRSYEIVDAGAEGSIFHLKKLVWEMILKPYRVSEQSSSAMDISYDIDSTLSQPLTAYGDNQWLGEEADDIDNYTDTDESVYGY